MKVMAMHQPWASLVVAGHKRIETRPRRTPKSMLGQRAAVHANKADDDLWRTRELPFALFIERAAELPRGYIIGTVVIETCMEMDEHWCSSIEANDPTEYAFGDWKPGRFGWVLADPVKFEVPMPFKAHQGWPDVDDGAIELASRVKVKR